ncbi:MAG TPA: DUF2007 domain-containing protein [Lacipirellulaceae bacterium]|nr:DUF2007 domain-containing protein [Lacipirellulaceae bacterium]
MGVVKVYKAGSSVEAEVVSEILDEAGIECRIVGEQLQSTLGVPSISEMASIEVLVSDADKAAARKLIDDWATVQFQQRQAETKRKLQYGMKWLLINFTLIACVFALYPLLGPNWHVVAAPLFAFIVWGNLMVGAYLHKQRERIS